MYDILTGVDSPVTTFRVCNERLTAIEPHEDGRFLAVGSHDGNIHLVECSEGHTVNTRTDKANFTAVSALRSTVIRLKSGSNNARYYISRERCTV